VIVLREVDDRDLDPPLRLEEVPVGFEGDALSLWKVRVS